MKNVLLLIGLFILSSISFTQEDSTLIISDIKSKSIETIQKVPERPVRFFERAWAPVGLAVISVDLLRDSTKYGLQTMARSFVADTFRTHVDDWIHYVPVLTMYAADLFKVPAKNTVWNQTKFLIISEAITGGIVWGLKIGLGIQRPNNGAYTAYPSGHTSQAFVQSQVLYNEFRDTAPLLAASGYAFSITTGALRVLNNRHWVPDVLLGAGLGMLVTNAVYYFEPFKDWNPFEKRNRKNKMQLNFMPSFNPDYMGGHLRLRF